MFLNCNSSAFIEFSCIFHQSDAKTPERHNFFPLQELNKCNIMCMHDHRFYPYFYSSLHALGIHSWILIWVLLRG